MDNQNNPNLPNNPNPVPPPASPVPSPNPWAPPPVPPGPEPLPSTPPPPPNPAPVESIPTFTPPPPAPTNVPDEPKPSLSPLDNPWGMPAQPPAIDNSGSTVQPSWMTATAAPAPAESIPTDLSHLINNNQSQPVETGQTVPESLVVPSNQVPTPEIPTMPIPEHQGIPKWLIGVGVGLIIIVLGASAYFILGIGQPKTTTSLPATTTAVQPPAPIATPTFQPPPPAATGSANFGQLGDSNGTQQATSAADAARQRTLGR